MPHKVFMSQQLAQSSVTSLAARIGLSARSLVYLLIAALLIIAAILPGRPDEGVSPSDAFRAIETDVLGRLLLIALALGLFAYAFWRYYQTVVDPKEVGSDLEGLLARLGMFSSANSYAVIGVAALLVTFGDNAQNTGGGSTHQFVHWLIEQPFGRLAVMLVGAGLIAVGLIQIWRTWSGQWRNGFALGDQAVWAVPLTHFAIAGRGVLFTLVGVSIVYAGIADRVSEVQGMAATLGWLRDQPFGFWLYLTSALIIGAYGVYSALQARYLEIG